MRNVKQTWNTSQDAQDWWCPRTSCGTHNGKKAQFCQGCGAHWEALFPWNAHSNNPDRSWIWNASESERTKSPRQPKNPRKPSRKERKEKKDKAKQQEQQQAKQELQKPSPFYHKVLAGGGALDPFSSPAPMTPATSSGAAASSNATNQELVTALKNAYVGVDQMPEEVKALIEKTEQESSKALCKSLHQATASLGKARKALTEITETRKLHRQRWTKHLAESIQLWETQLEEFRQVQANLQDQATKANAEISQARRSIAQLNSTNKAEAAQQLEEIVDDDIDIGQDHEAEVLQQRLASMLTACAAAVGAEVPSAIELNTDDELADDEESKKRRLAAAKPYFTEPISIEAYRFDPEQVTGAASADGSHQHKINDANLSKYLSVQASLDFMDEFDAFSSAARLRAEVLGFLTPNPMNDVDSSDDDEPMLAHLDPDTHHPLIRMPHRPAIQDQPEFIQRMHRLSRPFVATEVLEEGPIAYFRTWYLRGGDREDSAIPRILRLDGRFWTWMQRLQNLWQDVLDPSSAWNAHVVFPAPPRTITQGHVADVIVSQHVSATSATALITTTWDVVQDHDYVAVLVPQLVSKQDIIIRLNHRRWPIASYHVQFALQEIRSAPHRVLIEDGAGIVVHIHIPNDLALDHVSLLQRGAVLDESRSSMSTEEVHNVRQLSGVGRQTSGQVAHTRWPTPLQLSTCIPPPKEILIPFEQVLYMRNQILVIELGPISDMASIVKWKQCTIDAVEPLMEWTIEHPVALHFYTDGSASQDRAASAVFMIVESSQGQRFAGFRSLGVSSHPTAPYAESAAMTIALLWSAQVLNVYGTMASNIHVMFHFDCLLAGRCAAGHWRSQSVQTLPTVNRSLTHWLQAKFHCAIDWCHVPAHSGHPYNEAADAIAWATMDASMASRSAI
eukprot:Skav227382  [mRNA]  locus=scaffold3148:24141:26923:+ [translate_table: standard]